ncbi:methylthioribulose 1-phosphate dehydratase [Stenotrophomonas mori]|uniref:Methylthioribulose-1-phosphate dehydratase n=1 Tax=Stenotrophomonas mori TaxID=2871096 RepID=A0ABT0SEA1_9GAMM|nr:methylthioribulose 1-phosphate dehydratase [Stenotrophomonas mori]MCL7713642.1 methylthioribulose 1-phosphate dehydratase [Stenotrophomonas mori]
MNAPTAPYDAQQLSELARLLIENVRELAQAGWTPATSSNFSHRLGRDLAAITVSGKDKGRLVEDDIMVVDFHGQAVGRPLRPSAETRLHTQIYARFPEIGCVLHTHSPVQTIASRLYAGDGRIRLEGYELLKALHGNTTHDTAVDLEVFPNTQDMGVLSAQVEAALDKAPMWGYLIDGHGLYAWGRDMAEARRHLEAFEFLLHCELELRRLRA